MMKKIWMDLPKIDLHCHLDGSLTLGNISRVLGRKVEAEEVQVSKDCQSLSEYLTKFNIPLQCLQSYEGLRDGTKECIEALEKDHIRYVELRFAPALSVNENLQIPDVMEAVLEGAREAKKKTGIESQFIVCAMRHHSCDMNMKMLKQVRMYLKNGVCAADLAGDEASFPMNQFQELFEYAKKLDYPFTIHAGETGNAENIKQAVELGASRIGHGIAMKGRADIQRLCRERHIGIEMCPTSNMQTKAVDDLQNYPLREFLEKGLCVTVNTDNRTVSHTSMTNELAIVSDKLQFTEEEIYQLMKNAIEVSFASGNQKEKLMRMI